MFNYANQMQMQSNLPPDYQRLIETFGQIFGRIVGDFGIRQDVSSGLWALMSEPHFVMSAYQATIDQTGQYNLQQLDYNMRYFIQNYIQQNFGQPQQPRQQAVMSSHGGSFPANTQITRPISQPNGMYGPQGATQPEAGSGSGWASMMRKKSRQNRPMMTMPVNVPTNDQPIDVMPVRRKEKVYVVTETTAPVTSEPTDIIPVDDDFLKSNFSTYLRYQGQEGAPTLLSHIEFKYPFATKLSCMRFLCEHYPEFMAAERWVVAVDMPIVLAQKVDPHKAQVITQAFERVAEKLPTMTDLHTLLASMSSLLRNLGDDEYVHKIIFKRIQDYALFYMRNPEDYSKKLTPESWLEIGEMFRKDIAIVSPWRNANPDYDQMWLNVIFSAIHSVFPDGKSPIIDGFCKENRGLIATIPNIQIKTGKRTLRDHCSMSKDELAFCEQELKNRYILRKVPYRQILTNIPEDEVVSDEHPITVIPYSPNQNHNVSLLHESCYRLTLGVDLGTDPTNPYRLPEIMGIEGKDPSNIQWTRHVGLGADLSLILF